MKALRQGSLICIIVLVAVIPCWAGWQEDLTAAGTALNQKNYDEAIRLYKQALDTGEIPIKLFSGTGFNVKMNEKTVLSVGFELALTLKNAGNTEGAIAQLTELMEIYTPIAEAYSKNSLDGAFTRNLVTEIVHGYRSQYYAENTRYDLAIADLKAAIELANSDSMRTRLAWLLATCPSDEYRDGKQAIEYAQKALEKERKAGALNVLAAAYAEDGNFQEAIKIQEEAITLLKAEDQEIRAEYEKHLASYKEGKPWRMEPLKGEEKQ